MAHGGKMRVDFRHGDAVTGAGDGQSDDIPAMLADGEFVFPADVVAAIKAGGGKAVLPTVQGGKLTASLMGNVVMLTDAKGGMSHVRIADVMQSNGVIHVVDAVMLP